MRTKYIKIVWEGSSNFSLPRLMAIDENIDHQEIIEIIEMKAGVRVKRILPYQPKPQYLIMYTGVIIDDAGYNESLVFHLTPFRTDKLGTNLAEVKCFGKFIEAENIYDIIRYTHHDVVKEINGDSLCFNEVTLDSKGDYCSILKVMIGIFQTITSNISEKSYLHAQIKELTEIWEN